MSSLRGHQYYWRLANQLASPLGSPSIVVGPGTSFNLSLNLDDLLDLRIYRGIFEQAEMSVVSRLVTAGSLCVDVGANIGLYTVLLANIVGPSGRVISFEPSPLIRGRLEYASQNIPWVTVLPYALGAEESVRQLAHLTDTHATATLRELHDPAVRFSEVRVRRLDEVEQLQSVGLIDFLKVDVEGWESEVLKGAKALLLSGRLSCALIEVSPQWGETSYVSSLLASNEYRGFAIGFRPTASRIRLVPALFPLPKASRTQYNMLLVHETRMGAVADLVVSHRPRRRGNRRESHT